MLTQPSLHRGWIALLYAIFFTLLALAVIKVPDSWAPKAGKAFLFLFVFRYYRLLVGIVGRAIHQSVPIPHLPTIDSPDATVLIPTVLPEGPKFEECLTSICVNNPFEVLVITPTQSTANDGRHLCQQIGDRYGVTVSIFSADVANKRHQVARGIEKVTTPFIASADDSVIWPKGFLEATVAPFEDDNVAIVGTHKRVRRIYSKSLVENIYNLLGCLYLERHNFEILSNFSD